MIIEYLTRNIYGTNANFAQLLGLQSTRVKEILKELIEDGIIVAEGANRNRKYKLKK